MEREIKIKRNNVLTAFIKADPSGKQLLANLFVDEKLGGNIIDRIKTFEDAEAFDIGWTAKDEEYLLNVKKATIVTRVLNEGWEPDYKNKKQPKYYVWMQYDESSSAFRFGFTGDGYTYASTGTGSRHVFKTPELGKYFAEQFNSLVNKIIL